MSENRLFEIAAAVVFTAFLIPVQDCRAASTSKSISKPTSASGTRASRADRPADSPATGAKASPAAIAEPSPKSVLKPNSKPAADDDSFQLHLIPRQDSAVDKSDAAGSTNSGGNVSAGTGAASGGGAAVGSSPQPGGVSTSADKGTGLSAATPPVTKKIAEDDLKIELRDIHECLRRVEGALGEIKREADRRQMVVADPLQNDLGVMDPWSAACPGMMPYEGQPEMVGGAFLPPRTKFLKHSCDHIDSTFAELSASVDKLPQLVAQSNAYTDALDVERAKADSDILKDSTLHLGIKFSELRKICTIGEPDNVSLLRSVKEFDAVLKGMDEAAKRLWKDENPDTKN